jgi:hypothetical protein
LYREIPAVAIHVLIASTPELNAGSATIMAPITAEARRPRIVVVKAIFATSVTPARVTVA